jgi:hypothetical protein
MPVRWLLDPHVHKAIHRGLSIILRRRPDRYDVDAMIGALVEYNLIIVPKDEWDRMVNAGGSIEEQWEDEDLHEEQGCGFCGREGHKRNNCPVRL